MPDPPAGGEPADEPPQQTEPVAETPAVDPKVEKAKQLFREGNLLLKAGDYQRALALFLQSRRLFPSVPNTINAAVCLERLGRYDESLELYEELLRRFRDELTEEERSALDPDMSRLRSKVGSVDVVANVEGRLIIDGRFRGELPLTVPVRVMPGTRIVHVIKDGYEPFETEVEIRLGQTATVEATLRPLASAGRLRIDDASLEGAKVYIDGALVGTVPAEWNLAPGEHRYFLRRGDLGSAPATLIIVQGQTALVSPTLAPLGGTMRFVLEPPTAELLLNDVPVGQGGWQGRLPVGTHTAHAREEGYVSATKRITVDADTAGDVAIRLVVDEEHARWGVRETGEIFFDALGGVALTSGFDSHAERACSEGLCTSDPTALGFLVGARGGYEFWFGLSLEAAAGYVSLGKTLERRLDRAFTVRDGNNGQQVPTTYLLNDDIRLAGPFAAAGFGYRLPLGEIVQFRSHVLIGGLFAWARDPVQGTVTASGGTLPVALDNSGASVMAPSLLLMPELALGARFGGFSVGAGLALGIVPIKGPQYENGDLALTAGSCDGLSNPTAVDCTPGTNELASERAYGAFVMWLPNLSAGYAF